MIDSDTCGVLVVDAIGSVVASNSSARQLWSSAARPLVAARFAALFADAEDVADPESIARQWLLLKSEALDRWTSRIIRPLDGSPCEVRLRLERSSGGAGSYIATVQPVVR